MYRPLTLARLGHLLSGADESRRWRLVAEFLEEYRWEHVQARLALLAEEPAGTGDEHWDVFLAALAEHLAARDGRSAPAWAESRSLRRLWFPFNTPAARGCGGARVGGVSASRSVRRGAGAGGRVSEDDPLLDREAIAEAFRRLGERLARRGLTADVYVFGGAAMALAYDARRATRDIDAVFKPHGVVVEEAWAVADELGWPRWWLNEQASAYVAPGGDPSAPRV